MLHILETEPYLECLKAKLLFPDEEWLKDAYGRSLCPTCRYINRSKYPEHFDIVLDAPPGSEEQVSFHIETTGITIWKRGFLDMFSDHLTGFVLGKCLLNDGTVLNEYVTCYSSKYIVVRGNKQSRYRICPTCGTIDSEVKPGPQYVLERYLTDANIYQDARCRLFLSDEIVMEYNILEWNVSPIAISVRKAPADGQHLPIDP